VFAARYEQNSYIVFRKRLVSRRLTVTLCIMSPIYTSLLYAARHAVQCTPVCRLNHPSHEPAVTVMTAFRISEY
jgi:hypothetical protein